jgi:hypothetical protein
MGDEQWRDVADWEGLYQVSDLGRVRSLDRPGKLGSGGAARKGRVLRQGGNTVSYNNVGLCRDGAQVAAAVHRLVAVAFVERPHSGAVEVCHNDGNKRNNRASNLRWDTRQGNQADKRKHGTSGLGKRGNSSKIGPAEVRQIREMIAAGHLSHVKIGHKFGVSGVTVWAIRHGRTWAWLA